MFKIDNTPLSKTIFQQIEVSSEVTVWSPLSLLYATGSRHGEVAVWSRPFHSAVVNCRINDPSDESSILKLVWCDAHESGSQNLLAVATESRKVYIWSLFRKVSNFSHKNIFEFR